MTTFDPFLAPPPQNPTNPRPPVSKKNPATADDKKVIAELRATAERAEAADGGRCVNGEAVFWHPYDRALLPGHIYSDNGRDEFKISRACEFHFDTWFWDEEDG